MICIHEMPSKPDIPWSTQLFDYTHKCDAQTSVLYAENYK